MEIAGKPFGAWLLKWDTDTYETDDIGAEKSWSVFKTYRADAMEAGQPVVMWRSGSQAGVVALGHLRGPVYYGFASGDWKDKIKPQNAHWFVNIELEALDEMVPKATFKTDPVLSGAEVLRMPQGSNPSFLTADEFQQLQSEIETFWPPAPPPGPPVGSALKAEVEQAAIGAVIAELEAAGWRVQDVQADNLGWDLTARKRGLPTRKVEAKGRSGPDPLVILSRNEHAMALSEPGWELAIVTNALGATPSVTFYSAERATDGSVCQPFSWVVDLGQQVRPPHPPPVVPS